MWLAIYNTAISTTFSYLPGRMGVAWACVCFVVGVGGVGATRRRQDTADKKKQRSPTVAWMAPTSPWVARARKEQEPHCSRCGTMDGHAPPIDPGVSLLGWRLAQFNVLFFDIGSLHWRATAPMGPACYRLPFFLCLPTETHTSNSLPAVSYLPSCLPACPPLTSPGIKQDAACPFVALQAW